MMKISVSEGNSKMGSIASFSLAPVITCREGCKCARKCYARRMYVRRGNVKLAYDKNTEVACCAEAFFNQMDAWLTKNKPQFFRIHVSGDFFSHRYFMTWLNLVRRHKDTFFFAFTKQWNVIRSWSAGCKITPTNFSIILSAWIPEGPAEDWLPPRDLMKRFPVAWVVNGKDKDKFKEHCDRIKEAIPKCRMKRIRQCGGNCEKCGMCFHIRKIHGDVMLHLH